MLGKNSPFSTWVLLCAATFVMCLKEGAHWPDFTCHPFNETAIRKSALMHNRAAWVDCREPYEKWNGNCPQLCVLFGKEVLSWKDFNTSGPVTFDSENFAILLGNEMGYDEYNLEETRPELMDKVKSGIEGCKKKNPEFEKLKDFRSSRCEPWNKFLECVDKVVGC